MGNAPPGSGGSYPTRGSGMMANINLHFPVRKIPMRQWMRALASLDTVHPYWEDYRMLGKDRPTKYHHEKYRDVHRECIYITQS